MNILNLLNSQSIKEYWQEIDYRPSPLESAWIVYYNRVLPFYKKIEWWEQIIETTPDAPINRRFNRGGNETLHGFLHSYIDISRRFLDWFYDSENCFYMLKDADEGVRYDSLFSSVEKIKEFVSADEERSADYFVIRKLFVDDFRECDTAIWVNGSFEPVFQVYWGLGSFPHNEEEFDILIAFEYMWFNFPAPFRKGDVLFDPYHYEILPKRDRPGITDELYVFSSFYLDSHKERIRQAYLEGKAGDNTDMSFRGTVMCENGELSYDVFWNYMDFEIYKGGFSGIKRIIRYMSDYEKGLIDKDLFDLAYRQILTEEKEKENKQNSD